MSSSPEMTPMMDPRTQAKLAPMYTIDQILGHNTKGEGRSHQDPMSSPSIKGESVYIACSCYISLQDVYIPTLECAGVKRMLKY